MTSPKSAPERRRFERVSVTGEIQYSVSSLPDVVMREGLNEKRASIVNVSEGGMALVTDVALPEMTKLDIDLMLSTGKKIRPIHAVGQVCYAFALIDQIHYHMGIEFIALKGKDRKAIADFVRSRSGVTHE